jgi:DNA-binding protein H-NS
MKTYSAIRAEIAKLEKQAEAARKAEVAGVVGKIKKAIAAYGLTATDLGFGGGKTKKAASARPAKTSTKASTSVGVARYRDPKTQKTWTGRGKPPAWIAGVKDRGAYLISKTPADARPIKPAQRPVKEPRAGAIAKRSKATSAKVKARAARKTGQALVKTPAVQIESGVASE